MSKSFAVSLPTTAEPEAPKYDHGYTDAQIEEIKAKFKELEKRDKSVTPVTKKELKEIVIPHIRIGRTTVMNLQKEKPAKVAREPKAPKPAKEKALSKKAIKAELTRIYIKEVTTGLTEEEQAFLDKHGVRLI